MPYKNNKGFSLVEVLTAAIVITLSALAIIAVIRKGQEMVYVDHYRRAARAIVDTTLEGSRFLPNNIAAVPTTIANVSCTLDVKTKTPVGVLSVTVTHDSICGVKYDSICAKVKWTEPGRTTPDSVMISRLVPVIIDDQLNIAPEATATASSFNKGRIVARAIDGILGDSAEWVAHKKADDANPWILLTWSAARSINRIILTDRKKTTICIRAATLTFFNGATSSSMPLSGITKAPYEIIFPPRTVTSIKLNLTDWDDWPGFGEIEVFEQESIP